MIEHYKFNRSARLSKYIRDYSLTKSYESSYDAGYSQAVIDLKEKVKLAIMCGPLNELGNRLDKAFEVEDKK